MTTPEDEDRDWRMVQRRTRRPTSEWEAPAPTLTPLTEMLDNGRGLCADDVIRDRWVDDGNRTSSPLRLLCQRCPLIHPCLDYALDHDVEGIWGGTDYPQRKRMRRVRRQTPEPVRFAPYLDPTRSL